MGIRVNKAIGYGLVVNTDDVDSIVNTRQLRVPLDQYPEYLDTWKRWFLSTQDEFPDSLNDIALELSLFREAGYANLSGAIGRDVVKLIDYEIDDEGESMKTLVLITPISEKDKWYRYDNPIDYAEIVGSHEDMETKAQFQDHGFFPWESSFVNKKTGDRLRHQDMQMVQFLTIMIDNTTENRNKGESKAEETTALLMERERKCQEIGFSSYSDYVDNAIPLIPHAISHAAQYLRLFHNHDDTITELRPIIVTWWE